MIILTHGGAGSKNEHRTGTDSAVNEAVAAWENGMSLTDTVCLAVSVLEDCPHFNAGTGSHARSDGSVQMDAALMDSRGRFGAVACLENFKNPICVARKLLDSPNNLLCGRGAGDFAKEWNCAPYPLDAPQHTGIDFSLEDTVGCVAYDGNEFVAGLSSGGTHLSPPGRVGDVPLIGCGLYAGAKGAVACTGSGEAITLRMTAFRAWQLIEKGASATEVLEETLSWFDEDTAFGIILVTQTDYAGGANRSMAWSSLKL